MKTAGVVFDFYDDLKGSLLKTAFPTAEELPELVKTAHILSSEERDVLRDEAYALVMSNEGKILRKFACVDAGNTLLSCLYFEENAQRLPEEAIKVAAVNLASFCQDFGFEPTNFVKMAAAGHSRTRDSMRQPLVGDEADWAARTNLVSIRGGADSGRVIPTANQMKTAGVKTKALVGALIGGGLGAVTPDREVDPEDRSKTRPTTKYRVGNAIGGAIAGGLMGTAVHHLGETNKVIRDAARGAHKGVPLKKTHVSTLGDKVPKSAKDAEKYLNAFPQKEVKASVNLDSFHKLNPEADPRRGALTDDKRNIGTKSKAPALQKKSLPMKDKNTFAVGQGQGDLEVNYKSIPKIATIVDVSGKTPVHIFEKRASKSFALGNSYPLDSYADVSAAVQYFDDYWTTMNSADRHTYAVKTAARADELGIEMSEKLARYGSTEYAPDVDAHLASRKAAAPDFGAVYDAMREKRAEVDPETFVELLQKVDEEAGLNWYYGGDVTDPYLATFGGKEKAASSEWSWEGPNGETLNAEQLQGLVGKDEFNSSFDKDITSEFAKDPTAIFDSMPAPTKAIMARLALEE